MRLRFHDVEVDSEALEVTRGGELIALSPMAVRLLLHFAERSGEMVTRAALYEALWPDARVDRERLLNTYVRQIRAALGERAGDDRVLRTYPRRGYRFLPEVEWDRGGTGFSAGPASSKAPPAPGIGAPEQSAPHVARWALAAVASVIAVFVASSVIDGSRGGVGAEKPDDVNLRMGEELLAQPAPSDRAASVAYFRAAVAGDSMLARAHAGLAEGLYWAGDLAGARNASRRALELDPDSPRGHLVYGTAVLTLEWDWPRAERHLRAAVTRAPGDPDPAVALAFLLVSAGRDDEALALLDRTSALEPASAAITGDLGMLYRWLGHDSAALALCRRTIAIAPDAAWGHACAMEASRGLGRVAEVRARATDLVRLAGGVPEEVLGALPDPESDALAVRRYQLDTGSLDSHFGRAVALASLGRADEAIDALEAAAEHREPGAVSLAAHPALRGLGGHGGYESVRRQILETAAGHRSEGGEG